MENKYQGGKIYKITDLNHTECYIGSTTETLAKRLCLHKSCYKRYKINKVGCISSYLLFDKYGLDNCKIELIENYPCESKAELLKREGELMRDIPSINKRIAGRSKAEYVNDNRDKINKRSNDYYHTNKDLIKERYVNDTKDKKKAYYQRNRDRIIERNKNYYHKNKKSILI